MEGWYSGLIIFGAILWAGHEIAKAIKGLPGWQEYIDPDDDEDEE